MSSILNLLLLPSKFAMLFKGLRTILADNSGKMQKFERSARYDASKTRIHDDTDKMNR